MISYVFLLMDNLFFIMKNDFNFLVCVWVCMVNWNVFVFNLVLVIFLMEDILRFIKCRDVFGFVEFLYKGLWVQIVEKLLGNFCIREIVGFVFLGYFLFVCGCGFGVGFCVFFGFVKLLFFVRNVGEVVVLVWGFLIQQYRFFYLIIL